MVMASFRYIGRGLYSISEASRLAGVPAKRIRRWNHGYAFRDQRGQTRRSRPVVLSEIEQPSSAVDTIFFADLIEIRFVNILRNLGVSWPTIRDAADAARAELGEHPFASRRLSTDGTEIFIRVGDTTLMNIVTKQLAWRRILEKFLHDLDFDELDRASRWWPIGRKRRVVVDPARAFGTPIVVERVPTWVLASAVRAEGSVERAAWAYEVSKASVRDAVAFELRHGISRRV